MANISLLNYPFSILSTIILTYSTLYCSSCSSTEIQTEKNEICISIPENFIEHEKHHPKLSLDQRTQLVNKGYKLLYAIIEDQESYFPHNFENLSHHKEFNDHWKIPGIPYGNRSPLQIATDLVKSPFNFVVDTAAYCLWIQEDTGESTPEPQEECQHVAQLESITALLWALYDAAYNTGNPFLRGSILLEDSDKKIHNYLENYCCFAANVPSPDQLMIPLNLQASNLAYNRNYTSGSSHFVGRTLTQYGIDSRFRVRYFAIGVFPFKMSHLLFGRVLTHTGEELTFIKVEDEGLGDNRAMVRHTINYGLPVPKTNVRREKDIPESISEAFRCLIDSIYCDDIFTYNLLPDIFKNSPNDKNILEELLIRRENNLFSISEFQNSHKIDIAWMYKLLWDIKDYYAPNEKVHQRPVEILKNCDTLLEKMKELFVEQTLYLRTGNEVIFTDEDLKQMLKKYY